MKFFYNLAVIAIVTTASLFTTMVLPTVAQDNKTMEMNTSSIGMSEMGNTTRGIDNSSMGMMDGSPSVPTR